MGRSKTLKLPCVFSNLQQGYWKRNTFTFTILTQNTN